MERIQNSAKKRKQIKKRLEEDEVEDISQLTYRGLKRQGAIGEDVCKLIFKITIRLLFY